MPSARSSTFRVYQGSVANQCQKESESGPGVG